MQTTTHIPAGYTAVTPYIMVKGARELLHFLAEVFDAVVVRTEEHPDGTLGHTEIEIGGARLMVSDTGTEWPQATGAFYVYVADADQTYQRAVAAGARSISEPADQPYGDRHGGVYDAWGNQWWMSTPIAKG